MTLAVNRSRTRVLFIIPSLSAGGAERVFSILLRHLDRSRFELHLALLQGGGQFRQELPTDVTVHDLNVVRVRYALPALLKLVWTVRPAVVLSTLGHLNLALIAVRPLMPPGVRLVVREATMPGINLQQCMRRRQLWSWLYRRLYQRADGIVCPSDAVVEDLAANFQVPREKLVRIYNPVDVESVRAIAESARNPFIGPGPHLAVAGRLSREKGVDVLLAAMPCVLAAFPEAQLAVLGEGPILAELTDQSNRLGLNGRVHFLGLQRNPWRYMRHADVFVLPSRFEGLPNALLEALAVGAKGIVTSDCPGGIREIQSGNPQIVLVPPGDSRALADAIIALCKSPAAASDVDANAALQPFDLRQTVTAYSRILSPA